MKTLRIGTRASQLAWTQSGHAMRRLQAACPEHTFELVKITTKGDRDQSTPLVSMAGTGLFTKELEDALLSGEVDMAIHSLKDVPYETAHGCALGAFLERESPWDALVTPHAGLSALPTGALVGTSSPRRIAQLRAVRPDLRFADLRGNLDTRLARLDRGEYEAIVLAQAGLCRLGWGSRVREALGVEVCVPAFGQGILAVECRQDDALVLGLLSRVDDLPVRRAAQLERRLMLALGGGCKAALAALCQPSQGGWTVHASLGDPATGTVLREVWNGADDQVEPALDRLAARLLERAGEAGLVWK
jgi:hydroxymethylbilane synthase